MSFSSIVNWATMSERRNSSIRFLAGKSKARLIWWLKSQLLFVMKVQDDTKLRTQVAREESEQISTTALAIHERLRSGGKLIIFGNGGSATDANDLAIDCVHAATRIQIRSRGFACSRAGQHYCRRQ